MRHACLLLALAALPALAAEPAPRGGTLVEFRVDVQKSVANDLGRASAFVETSGADAAEVARKIKAVVADGLALAKAQPGIAVRSGGTHTWPVYTKGGRQIEGWRMRAEILLESRDAAALAAAAGKLQTIMALGGISFAPAPETRRKAEDEATLEGLEAFRVKAERIAAALRKDYRIRSLNVGGAGQPPLPLPRAAALMAESAPLPVEPGESSLTLGISGQIELLE